MRKPLSSRNQLFYFIIVRLRRLARRFEWRFGRKKYAKSLSREKLPFGVYKFRSVLIRKQSADDAELLRLQRNKIINSELDLKKINGIIIRPGETFSYFYLTRRSTKRKGYIEAILLVNGKPVKSVGGGVCHIANMMHWLCLNSPLDVIERHPHSVSLFPDEKDSAPFGSDASIFYNYKDYQFANHTPYTFQLLFSMDEKYLNGELRVSEELPYGYNVFEKNHLIFKKDGCFYRMNELWREKVEKSGDGNLAEIKLLQKNFSPIKYTPESYKMYKDMSAFEKDMITSFLNSIPEQ